jgi:hypothetical protein
MVNDDDLRQLMAAATGVVRADEARPARALYAGQRRRRRQWVIRSSSVLTVVAVIGSAATFVLSTPDAPASVAAVECGRPAANSATMRVTTTDTGLPVRVNNETSSVAQVSIDQQGATVPPGVGDLRLAVSPGHHELTCTTESGQRTVTSVEVIDSLALWTHGTAVNCPYPRVYDATGRFMLGEGDPAALMKRWFGPQPQDAVMTVGYPQTSQRLVAVKRDGRPVAVATWHQLLPGTWTLGVVRICYSAIRPPTEVVTAA